MRYTGITLICLIQDIDGNIVQPRLDNKYKTFILKVHTISSNHEPILIPWIQTKIKTRHCKFLYDKTNFVF